MACYICSGNKRSHFTFDTAKYVRWLEQQVISVDEYDTRRIPLLCHVNAEKNMNGMKWQITSHHELYISNDWHMKLSYLLSSSQNTHLGLSSSCNDIYQLFLDRRIVIWNTQQNRLTHSFTKCKKYAFHMLITNMFNMLFNLVTTISIKCFL